MIKSCAVCGKEFEAGKLFKKYCSQECAAQALKEQNQESARRCYERKREAKLKLPKRIKHCEHCGKEFEPYNSTQNFCSSECWHAEHRAKPKLPTKSTTVPIVIKPGQDALALRRIDGRESVCMWCENPVADPRQHFCSDDCLLKFCAKKFSSLSERGLQ